MRRPYRARLHFLFFHYAATDPAKATKRPSRKVGFATEISGKWPVTSQHHRRRLGSLQRKGLALYSARHTFKGFIDDLRGLSEQSRRIVMGHANTTDTSGGYGPKSITEEQAEVILGLSNSMIERMTTLLLGAKERADRGKLKIIDAC